MFGLKRPHPDEEEELLQQLYTKDSPQFHRFLTADEWIARFAPSPEDEQKVVEWIQSQGLTITSRYPNRLSWLLRLRYPELRRLNVRINNYRSGSNTFFSNDRDPVFTAEVDALIDSVQGLNNLAVVHPADSRIVPDYSPGPAAEPGVVRHGDARAQRTERQGSGSVLSSSESGAIPASRELRK